jgi:hypothetical protein
LRSVGGGINNFGATEWIQGLFLILEVAVDPSYTIFFLEAWQKRLFCCLR